MVGGSVLEPVDQARCDVLFEPVLDEAFLNQCFVEDVVAPRVVALYGVGGARVVKLEVEYIVNECGDAGVVCAVVLERRPREHRYDGCWASGKPPVGDARVKCHQELLWCIAISHEAARVSKKVDRTVDGINLGHHAISPVPNELDVALAGVDFLVVGREGFVRGRRECVCHVV